MDFSAAASYLLGTINETVSRRMPYRLERMRAFLHELGDPQTSYPTIHVGGTSGKGSTSTIVAAILQASGKRVALHTKPHLRSMTERARIDGVPVTEERFAELLTSMMPAIERTAGEHGRPTYYETLLALAFCYFREENVDLAVIEVGLGGRLDGTNVIVPMVSAITSVGFDHMDVLGETIQEIAAEKAGIAKPNVPLVLAVENIEARDVIEAHAREVGAPIVDALSTTSISNVRVSRSGQLFDVISPRETYSISTPMLGEFQRRNVATAIRIIETLPPSVPISRAHVENALASLTIPGRMEFFAGSPAVIFDIAHNEEKAEHLVRSLQESFPDRRFTFVMAIGASKDAAEIIRRCASLPSRFIFTNFDTAGRTAAKPQRLGSIAEQLGTWARVVSEPMEALSVARRTSGPDDIVVVTGSTFIVATLREWWLESVAV